ncbi:hypothetical protein AHAS_Ahas11G0261900 [Arachis hypogaea]
MLTRSKTGSTKPKNFLAINKLDLLTQVPKNVPQTLNSSYWKSAMDSEYNALIKCRG